MGMWDKALLSRVRDRTIVDGSRTSRMFVIAQISEWLRWGGQDGIRRVSCALRRLQGCQRGSEEMSGIVGM